MDNNETARERPRKLDKPFVYALDHFIRIRGWSVQFLCQKSRQKTPDSPVHPHLVTKWRAGKVIPSMASVLSLCRLFGVPRSFFFHVGERLVALEEELQASDEERQQLRVLLHTVPHLDEENEDLLRDLETYIKDQKAHLARRRADREG